MAPPKGNDVREYFQKEIDDLVDVLISMADSAIEMLGRSVDSLMREDGEAADLIIRADDAVDERYVEVQNRVVRLMALQAPVASDLRLISSMLHVNIHLERMGDYGVNIAKFGKLGGTSQDDTLVEQLQEMASIAADVARQAITSYAQRDVESAWELPDLDDGVDQLNIGMFKRLVRLAAQDESTLEWATRMIMVARQIERFGDHAVDIGEATIFVVTGETVELSSNAPGRRWEIHGKG